MPETIWEFETARFRVALEVEPEDFDPADRFEFEEDIEYARSGDLAAWFSATVKVYLDGRLIGRDDLGACSYRTLEEFYTGHRDPNPLNRNCTAYRAAHGENAVICHYFPGMVLEAIRKARNTLAETPKMRAVA